MNHHILQAYSLLKYAFGISLILIGIDKVLHTNIFTDWEQYVSPLALSILPLTSMTLVSVLGFAEIVVGILFLTRFAAIAAIIAIITLIAIIVNLFSLGLYDIALRDLLIVLSLYVFLLLNKYKIEHSN